MGFDIRKAISKFSSSKPLKQERILKQEEKVSTSSSTTTTTTTTATTTATHQARRLKRKDGKVVKSVTFVDCDCDRNVKVAPFTVDSTSGTTTTSTTKSVHSSTPQPSHRPSSSSADSNKRRSFERSLTPISHPPEDPPVPKSPISSLGSVIIPSDNPGKTQIRLPSPRGLHSRNLSYGTIYNASKAAGASREHSPCPKDDRSNAKLVTTPERVPDNQPTSSSTKPTRSVPHVFGLGGCNYGHGSIINGVKTLKSAKANNNDSVFSYRKDEVGKGKLRPLDSSSSSCGAYVVEELKKMGNEEYRKGQFKKALSLYDRAIRLDPRNAPCHLNKAAALANLGRIKEAVDKCLQAIDFDPSYSRAHYRLGMLYTRLGHIEDAKKHFQLSGHTHNSEAMRKMLAVEACLLSMRRALKMEDWQKVLVESSRSHEAGADACDEAVAAKAEALLKLHRAHDALEILVATKNNEDRKLPRGCLRLLLLEAQIYLYLGRFDEGVRAAEEAVNTEFNKDSLLQLKKAWGSADAYKAGNEYYNAGRLSEACAMYAQGLQYIPTNPALLCRRATCRMKAGGQWEGAIEDLNAVLKSNPNHSEAFILRAQALTKIGRGNTSQRESVVVSRKWK